MSERLVVTGGLGFIGSAFLRRCIERGQPATNLDARTYAADPRRLPPDDDLVVTKTVDVAGDALAEHVAGADVLVHFAAETHVTRSEADPPAFYRANVEGTKRVLEAAAGAGVGLVIHVSTDEVYGPARARPFAEDDKAPGEGRATSAYARSKALADDLALSFDGSPDVVVVRPTNCFGPWQHPEKAVPRWITRALSGERLPVWGDGGYVRDWMFVDDVCAAIETLIDVRPGRGAYNVGPEGNPLPNRDVATAIARFAGRSDDAVYLTAYDRPSHDRRYSVDSSKIRALGWAPAAPPSARLRETVEWYAAHREWWEPLVPAAEALYDDAQARA